MLTRLLALPYAALDTGDAVSRVHIAQRWLDHPHVITHGIWGPLHTYLIAIALTVFPDPVVAPNALNAVFGSATAIPLYLFTKRVFGERGGLFVGLMYLFYPVAFRYSLMSVSEIPFCFFVAVTLWFGGLARQEKKLRYALGAGIALTTACMLRYEGWVLIFLLAALFAFNRTALAVFQITALLFPVFWMWGNGIHHGDVLYGIHVAHDWQVAEGINENWNLKALVRRITFFPLVLFLGLTPFVAVLCLAGCALSIWTRRNRIYLIAPLGLLALDMVRALQGALLLRTRYSVVLGLLLLPFAAFVFEHLGSRTSRLALGTAVLLSIGVFSYAHRIVPPQHIESIPTMEKSAAALAERVVSALEGRSDALVCDFFGSQQTAHVLQRSRLHPDRIHVARGGRRLAFDRDALRVFLESNPTGVLVLAEGPLAREFGPIEGPELRWAGHQISLDPLGENEGVRVYRYRVVTESAATRLR